MIKFWYKEPLYFLSIRCISFFKELDIDQDQTFTADFTKENEIESVVFDKDNEYAITGLKINAELPDKKI